MGHLFKEICLFKTGVEKKYKIPEGTNLATQFLLHTLLSSPWLGLSQSHACRYTCIYTNSMLLDFISTGPQEKIEQD